MDRSSKILKVVFQVLSYVLVIVLTVGVTLTVNRLTTGLQAVPGSGKLYELLNTIEAYYIDDADRTAMEDAAADAMVQAAGDRWSYYIPASQMQQHIDRNNNSYVGVGVTVIPTEDGTGSEIIRLEPGGSAKEAGLLPGDIIVAVEGQRIAEIGMQAALDLVAGKEGTQVQLTVLRDGQEQTYTMVRKTIQEQVASGKMLDNNIGYIRIANFSARCASETIALAKQLQEQGAKAFIFDVRFNPGGYVSELVDLLDYLLPEGKLFTGVDYAGNKQEYSSGASCVKLPMAVLMNGDSYSAAEFFAAALTEYEWAFTVGQATTGKGKFQQTIMLSDGSAVNLSVGKYFTPKGVSLSEKGGLVPDYPIEVDDDTASKIYSELLDPAEDPQVLEAVRVLLESGK